MAEPDSEETAFAPGVRPTVLDDPEINVVLFAPTDDLDGVTSQKSSSLVLIDSSSIVSEVFVDEESSVNGAVLVKVLLDGLGRGQPTDAFDVGAVTLAAPLVQEAEAVTLSGVSRSVGTVAALFISADERVEEEGSSQETSVATVVEEITVN